MPFKDTSEGQTHHEHDECNSGKGHEIKHISEKEWLREQVAKGIIREWAIAGKDGYFVKF